MQSKSASAPGGTKVVLGAYLLGLLIGGLYLGAVSPVRTVIQADFGIDGTQGIWMINIYSLFYASLIPIVGKLADRRGRKRVFVTCVGVFGAGSVLCGLSQAAGGFPLLLVGRVLQAAGAGGMIPVANSQIATTVSPERRGAALGAAAAITGLSNVLGAAVGSLVVGMFGASNWPYLFYLGVPFCILVMAVGTVAIPADGPKTAEAASEGAGAAASEGGTQPAQGKADVLGSILFMAFVLLLLLGIRGIDWANAPRSILQPAVLGSLAGAVAAAAVFRQVERRAEDPVFHMEYLHSRPIVVTMVVSFFIGCFVISLVLVPELAEFAMDAPLGSGGYYILAIGAASIIAPPIGGRIIDRVGPKPVLAMGFAIGIAGLLYLALVAVAAPSVWSLLLGLLIIGAGMGFAMGAPTNYMILENAEERDSTSAIATITLVRQIGTSIAPAILTGLIASAPGMAGYQHMLLGVVALNACALVAVLFYRSPAKASE